MTHCDNGFPKRNVKKNWLFFSIFNLNWKLNGINDNEYSDKVWFMASYHLVPFFPTIWRFCVLILSPIRISFAALTKMVSTFLTIQFHPSTACLLVARLSVWRLFFWIFWFLLFSTIWEPELETRFVCIYSISPHFLDALSSAH